MTQALTTTNGHGRDIMARITEFQTVSKLFAESGLFTDTKTQAQCFVKVMAGAEMGLPPFTAMNAFHIIQGKVAMAASTIAARIKSSGRYNYITTEKTAARCVVDFYEHGKKIHTETWDAARAGKAGVKNMDKFPDAMLFSRAISAGARVACPDVIGSYYTPEEMGADVDAEGEVVVSAVVHQAPTPAAIVTPAMSQPYTAEERATASAVLTWLDANPIASLTAEKHGAHMKQAAAEIGCDLTGLGLKGAYDKLHKAALAIVQSPEVEVPEAA